MELDFVANSAKSSSEREHVFNAVELVLDEFENQHRNLIDKLDDGARFRTGIAEILDPA